MNQISLLSKSRKMYVLLFYFLGANLVLPILTYTLFPKMEETLMLLLIYAVLAIGIYFLCRPYINHDVMRIHPSIFFHVLKGLGLIYLVQIAIGIVLMFIVGDANSENQQAIISLQNQGPIFVLMTVSIFAPFVEEVIFRGVIFAPLKNRFGFLFAAIFSSFLFGFIHVYASLISGDYSDLWFIFTYAGLGFVFSYVYYKSENIFTCILLHGVYNTIAFLIVLNLV